MLVLFLLTYFERCFDKSLTRTDFLKYNSIFDSVKYKCYKMEAVKIMVFRSCLLDCCIKHSNFK